MRATINATVNISGETATVTKTRTTEGNTGLTPSATPAVAGVLSTRGSNTAGTIVATSPTVETGSLAILTWTDASGNLKHRYNVACTVTEDPSSAADDYDIDVSGGSGDNLPDALSDINIALQVSRTLVFDFDDVDTFIVTTNVRGVVVFRDAVPSEKCVIDMEANGLALWIKSTGFAAPMSGTQITHVLVGSGDTSTTNFLPKIACLYDATITGSGQ
jgi:hypothetical protein